MIGRGSDEGGGTRAGPEDLPLRWVLLLFVACYLPFLGTAFHIDDPLFLWVAQHLHQRPLDFYGFPVNWYGTWQPMSEVTKNPPLASYFAALWALPFGFGEVSMHLAFLLPALGALAATYLLAKELCRRPGEAALVTAAMPAFFVSSTSVMCDVTMLCGWLWSIVLFRRALATRRSGLFALTALVITASALTKYFAAALIPLLALYGWRTERRPGAWLAWLLVPVIALAGFQAWTHHLYGAGLLSDAASYATTKNRAHGALALHLLVALAFIGGCFLPALYYVARLWSRKVVVGGILAALALALILGASGVTVLIAPFATHRWSLSAQAAILFVSGVGVLALVFIDLRRRPGPESLLLATWVLGTLAFATGLNWTVNARSLLPMGPAIAILMMRRLDEGGRPTRGARILPLVFSATVTLMVAAADARLAQTAKEAALQLGEQAKASGKRVWFEGHWGFQYYAQLAGLEAIDYRHLDRIQTGEVIALPSNNTNVRDFVRSSVPQTRATLDLVPFPGLATMSNVVGAGFYADVYGPVPFAFGDVPLERYTIILLQ